MNRRISINLLLISILCIYQHKVVHCESLQYCIDVFSKKIQSSLEDPILLWNEIAVQSCGNDYDPDIITGHNQGGPTFTSRALAIIHGCMYEAYNYYYDQSRLLFHYEHCMSVEGIPKTPAVYVSITEAAYQTLIVLYPSQTAMFKSLRDLYIQAIQSKGANQDHINLAIALGQQIASIEINERAQDGYNTKVDYKPKNLTGFYQLDPTHPKQVVVTPQWGNVKPFFLECGWQFRCQLNLGTTLEEREKYLHSDEYRQNYEEIKEIGRIDSKTRTADQTEIGLFWAYDGGLRVGVPPKMYNQIVRVVAEKKKTTFAQNARLFAIVNYALADAAIAAWDTKFYYDFWRPITGIRSGYPNLPADPTWIPLGAPPDDGTASATPAFPSFISGHACFGSTLFQVLRRFFNTDNIDFCLQSDEYDGKAMDCVTKQSRPKRTRCYTSLTQAETENKDSRLYLGVHWTIDQVHGASLGKNVANYVCDQLLR